MPNSALLIACHASRLQSLGSGLQEIIFWVWTLALAAPSSVSWRYCPLGSESEPAFFLSYLIAVVMDIPGRSLPFHQGREVRQTLPPPPEALQLCTQGACSSVSAPVLI